MDEHLLLHCPPAVSLPHPTLFMCLPPPIPAPFLCGLAYPPSFPIARPSSAVFSLLSPIPTGGTTPYVIPAQVRQVRQLLHLDDAVIETGLQTLGHHVGEDDGNHHGQDVGDLTRQLKADHCCGDSVAHCSCQGCCAFPSCGGRGKTVSCRPGDSWRRDRKKKDVETHQ